MLPFSETFPLVRIFERAAASGRAVVDPLQVGRPDDGHVALPARRAGRARVAAYPAEHVVLLRLRQGVAVRRQFPPLREVEAVRVAERHEVLRPAYDEALALPLRVRLNRAAEAHAVA